MGSSSPKAGCHQGITALTGSVGVMLDRVGWLCRRREVCAGAATAPCRKGPPGGARQISPLRTLVIQRELCLLGVREHRTEQHIYRNQSWKGNGTRTKQFRGKHWSETTGALR